jgi:hypothetical protein
MQSTEQHEQTQRQPKVDAAAIIKGETGDLFEEWFSRGIECSFVLFQKAISRQKDAGATTELRKIMKYNEKTNEPMSERKNKQWVVIDLIDSKYYVEKIVFTPYGVLWKCNGERNIAPLGNVADARLL